MLSKINPRLRRSNIMLDGLTGSITNTSKKFAWAPEMSFFKIISKPGMFLQQSESRSTFEQLQSFTKTHGRRKFNKQMHMINCNMQLVNFTPVFNCNFFDESLTIHPDPIEFHGISSIFRFPYKMEGILPEAMAKGFQFHFLTPQTFIRNKVLTMFETNLFKEGNIYPSLSNTSKELNLTGGMVSPPLLKSEGIRNLAM